jgi:nucleotide-binding universal stress UspA family protein
MENQVGQPMGGAPAAAPTFASALCAVDGKGGGFAALEQAAALLGAHGRMTILVVTSYRQEGERRSPAIGPLRAHDIVTHARELAAATGLHATVEVEPSAPPARVVLDWAEDHDLLALGAPASSWLGGMLIAGVGDTALASFSPALLAARQTGPGGLNRQVLIASDGGDGSDAPLAVGTRLARAGGGDPLLVHALGPLHRSPSPRVLEQGRALFGGSSQERLLVRRGPSHEVICDDARERDASLVVMGSRRLGGLRALGSVSRRVVHEAPCSVLLVPPGPHGV